MELLSIERLHLHNGGRIHHVPAYHRMSPDEESILTGHKTLLDWLEKTPNSPHHYRVAEAIRAEEDDQDIAGALVAVSAIPFA